MRIAGVTIPDNKQLAYSLPLIYGIGPTRALDILKKAEIAPTKKGSELTSEEEQRVRALAEGYTIEGELRREIGQNIKRLKDIKSRRGNRHERDQRDEDLCNDRHGSPLPDSAAVSGTPATPLGMALYMIAMAGHHHPGSSPGPA